MQDIRFYDSCNRARPADKLLKRQKFLLQAEMVVVWVKKYIYLCLCGCLLSSFSFKYICFCGVWVDSFFIICVVYDVSVPTSENTGMCKQESFSWVVMARREIIWVTHEFGSFSQTFIAGPFSMTDGSEGPQLLNRFCGF